MSVGIERASLLLEQGRYELAEKELRAELATNPEDGLAHAFLALSLVELDRNGEALREADLALGLLPDEGFSHYVRGAVLADLEREKEALESAREAVRLEPEEADYRALLAALAFDRRRWTEALKAAEQGLQLDPEHSDCANIRSMALVHLRRPDEARAALQHALYRHPENAGSHTAQGWTLLHAGDHAAARLAFKEALRLDPTLEPAREGMLESLKARNFIYRAVLKYFLWMTTLSGGTQLGIVFGAMLGARLLSSFLAGISELAFLAAPVRRLYIAVALFTWIAEPLFDLFLFFDPFGRYLLDKQRRLASYLIGGLLVLGAGLLLSGWLTDTGPMLFAGLTALFLMIPVAATFQASRKKTRHKLAALAGVPVVLFVFQLVLALAGHPAAEMLGYGVIICTVAFSWIANIFFLRA